MRKKCADAKKFERVRIERGFILLIVPLSLVAYLHNSENNLPYSKRNPPEVLRHGGFGQIIQRVSAEISEQIAEQVATSAPRRARS